MDTAASTASAPTTDDFSEIFAAFTAQLEFDALPASTVRVTQVDIYDTLICALAGFNAPGVPAMRELVEEWGGKPEASVLWTKTKVPAPNAAWVNGIMSHACDYDDTHDLAIVHGGISVIPAALAAAEIAGRPIDGREFVTAVAAGLELICRVGVATKIGLIEAGFIYSALLSHFAATVAAARILRMDADETANALGIAYSQAGGTHQVTRDGALTKRMQPGFGARTALTSIAMTRKGVTGARKVFEGIDGLSRTYLKGALDSVVLREGLGTSYHLDDLAFKPYPSCRMNHCAIDAALRLREKEGFDWREVDEITIYMNTQGYQAVGTALEVRRAPKTTVQAQFSVCYNVACALVNGVVGVNDFTAEAFGRADIIALAARITPVVDPEMDKEMGRGVSPARIVARLGDSILTTEVTESKGSIGTPLTDEDLRRKLEDCLAFGGFPVAAADIFEATFKEVVNSSDVVADFRTVTERLIG